MPFFATRWCSTSQQTIGTIVDSSLNDHFTKWWIGRVDSIPWLPRCPDMMTLDFLLWGFVKEIVYRRKVWIFHSLMVWIKTPIAAWDTDMIARSWSEIDYRLDIPRLTKDVQVEVSWHGCNFFRIYLTIKVFNLNLSSLFY